MSLKQLISIRFDRKPTITWKMDYFFAAICIPFSIWTCSELSRQVWRFTLTNVRPNAAISILLASS